MRPIKRIYLGIALFLISSLIPVLVFLTAAYDGKKCPRGICIWRSDGIVFVDDIGVWSGPLYLAVTLGPWVRGNSPLVVRIDSSGGPMRSARWMSWWTAVLAQRIDVRFELPAGTTCQSSCTYFWSSARERWAHPAAQFMFHGPAWGPARRAGAGLEDGARLMEDGIRRVDPILADTLMAAGAFVSASVGVWKNAKSIAELGGDYLRLDSTLQ